MPRPKTAAKLQVAGVTTAVVAGAAVVGVILFSLRSGLKEAAGGVDKAVSGAGSVVGAAGSGLQAVGDTSDRYFNQVRSLFQGDDFSDPVKASEFKDGRGKLELAIIDKDNTGRGGIGSVLGVPKVGTFGLIRGGRTKKNEVLLEVRSGGRPVVGAEVTMKHPNQLSRTYYGDRKGFTNSQGRIAFAWETEDIGGTATEDDGLFVARKAGYNPSNTVLVK